MQADIWKVAGYEEMQKKTHTPDDFSFDKCPRALMFERASSLAATDDLHVMAIALGKRHTQQSKNSYMCNTL